MRQDASVVERTYFSLRFRTLPPLMLKLSCPMWNWKALPGLLSLALLASIGPHFEVSDAPCEFLWQKSPYPRGNGSFVLQAMGGMSGGGWSGRRLWVTDHDPGRHDSIDDVSLAAPWLMACNFMDLERLSITFLDNVPEGFAIHWRLRGQCASSPNKRDKFERASLKPGSSETTALHYFPFGV